MAAGLAGQAAISRGRLRHGTPAFSYLRTIEDRNERMVAQTITNWNQLRVWLGRIDLSDRCLIWPPANWYCLHGQAGSDGADSVDPVRMM